jgi:hypothetical protein
MTFFSSTTFFLGGIFFLKLGVVVWKGRRGNEL